MKFPTLVFCVIISLAYCQTQFVRYHHIGPLHTDEEVVTAELPETEGTSPLTRLVETINLHLFKLGKTVRGIVSNSATWQTFRQSGIVPVVIPTAPRQRLNVLFPNGATAMLGNPLLPEQTEIAPNTIQWNARPGHLYTLVALNAIQKTDATFLHWLVVNIPGDKIYDGQTLAEYIPANPEPRKGNQAYVYLIYEQQSALFDPEFGYLSAQQSEGRRPGEWDLERFVDKHMLGDVVAGNFFVAKCSAYARVVTIRIGRPDPGPC